MIMTTSQLLITILACALATLLTRVLPFLLFPPGKPTPRYIQYLGRVLPYSVMGLLIVYCLKAVDIVKAPYGLPELISILLIFVLHVWKRNTLLSIMSGTAVYMMLIQLVFK